MNMMTGKISNKRYKYWYSADEAFLLRSNLVNRRL